MDIGGMYYSEKEINEYLDDLVISDQARMLCETLLESDREAFIHNSVRDFLEAIND
jgi:hypothetical protein